MSQEYVFHPERRWGTVFQIGAVVLLGVAGSWGLWQASQAVASPAFLFTLLPALMAWIFVPLMLYRIYALHTAHYTLEREGVHLRWGLRIEDIPMDTVLWVRSADELKIDLALPWLRWPGSALGVRSISGIGEVEYLASRSRRLILIATTQRVFAVSPADEIAFLRSFQRCMEMGSLSPLTPRSVYPTFLFTRVWSSRPARFLLLGSLIFSLMLLITVSVGIATHAQVTLGFDASGDPRDRVPAVRLMLLPVLSSFFVLADVLIGLFFYRREQSQALSFLLWVSGALTPALFWVSVLIILNTA